MKRRLACLGYGTVLVLTACASSYPPLYTPIKPTQATTGVAGVLYDAAVQQQAYQDRYLATARHQDAWQLPIIAAAAAAAAILYDSPNDSLDLLAGLGIGTAAYSATRSTLAPPRLPELYILGHSAIGCIRSEGRYFTGSAAAAPDIVRPIQGTLAIEIANARGLFETARLSANASDAQRQEFQVLMAALNSATIAAAQALANSRNQLVEFERAETVFGHALASTHARVATLARAGRIVNFDALRTAFTANIAAAGTPAPLPPAAAALVARPSDDDLISLLRTRTNELTTRSLSLTAATPDYAASLVRVAACPQSVQ